MRRRSPRALRIGTEVYHALKKVLGDRGLATGVGDEGGFAPDLESSEAAIEAILEAAERAGHRDRIAIALDPAASEVFSRRRLSLRGPRDRRRRRCRGSGRGSSSAYPIVSIEDGCAEDDWDAWRALTERLGDRVQLVGDDLFVTNPERLQQGIDRGVANSILVKVNQIGTLTETIEAVQLAHGERLHGRHVAPLRRDRGRDDRRPGGRARHRADQDRRSRAVDRVAKYNQLLRIEEELGRGPAIPAGTRSRERSGPVSDTTG